MLTGYVQGKAIELKTSNLPKINPSGFTVIIYDNKNNVSFDVSDVVSDMTITTYLYDNPGKCEFTIQAISPLTFYEGAAVSVIIDGFKMFKGYVFKKSRNQEVDTIKVTAYDQLRYLKNKDFRVFEGVTSSQIFSQLCDAYALKYKIVDPSTFVCPPRSEDATSLYDMIKNALDATLAYNRQWFFIRDNYGVLEHKNILSCLMGVMLGDESGVTGFEYESSIDTDVYNQIKLYRDNKDSKKRDTFIVNDTVNGGETLKRWGILQLYEKVDEKMNLAQIEDKALKMLSYYNSTRRTLKLNSLGVKEFYAGCLFKCQIKDLGDISMNSYLLVTECSHKFKNNEHTMSLTTEIVRGEYG